jgi:hypothetical protein
MRLVLSQGYGRRHPGASGFPQCFRVALGLQLRLAAELIAAQKGFAVTLAATLTPELPGF